MKYLCLAIVVTVLGLVLSACQAIQGSGPYMANASSVAPGSLPYDVIDLTPQSVIAFRPDAAPKAGPATPPVSSLPSQLAVSRGDVLSVHIVERYAGGIFSTLQGSDTLVVTRQVSPDGRIEVPFVGTVEAAGRDPRQIQSEIQARLAGKANDPQVIVALQSDRTYTVMVSGEVSKPGTQSLLDGPKTLVEAIDRAGGPLYPSKPEPQPGAGQGGTGAQSSSAGTGSSNAGAAGGAGNPGAAGYGLSAGGGSFPIVQRGLIVATPKTLSDASQMRVVLRRQGNVIVDQPYSTILSGNDVGLQKGDEIVVSPNTQVVTILGAVAKSGNLPIVKQGMTLADALGEASGLFDPVANTTGVYLFRAADGATVANTRNRIFRLDLLQPVAIFVAQQFAVQPRDVIFISNAPLYEYDKFLTPLYRTLSSVNAVKPYTTGPIF